MICVSGVSLTAKFCQAMYPALILVIVNKDCSIVNTFGFSTDLNIEDRTISTEQRPPSIGHLVFAGLPTKSIVDNEQSLSCSPKHSTFPGRRGSSDSYLARAVELAVANHEPKT
jgi:hypothetical protein